jgi:hypothetical protein
MSTQTQQRTVTVEEQDGTTIECSDGQRLAWSGDAALSMTLRVGPHSIWFDKETSPAGIRLSSHGTDDTETPTWSIGGGGMRPPARTKLAGLLRNGWELVGDDVGLNR